MRWLWLCLFLCFTSAARAAAIPLTLPAGIASPAASTFVTTASQAFSGAAFNSGLTTTVAGRALTVPATWRLASNAGQIAVGALRLNPAGLVTSAVAAWLLQYGLSYVAGQFQKQPTWYDNTGSITVTTYGGADVWIRGTDGKYRHYYPYPSTAHCGGSYPAGYLWQGYYQSASYPNAKISGCAWFVYGSDNATYGVANLPGSTPAESDWAAPSASALPDAVAKDLSAAKVALPLTPQVAVTPQSFPLSDPYIDPVTGKRFRDMAYITPNANDPTKADLQVVKQEVDAEGNPVTDPTTGGSKAPEKQDDPCLGHESRLGCMDKGDIPAAPDITNQDKTISITPDSGWGADTASCPADLTTSFLGKPVAWSFKPVCDGADMLRPVVIAMAWFSAVLLALGISKRSA